jgi:hypothetical protein
VILVGYNAGILDENILNGTVILLLITCIVASVVTEKAARKIVVSDENSDSVSARLKGSLDEHLLIPINNINEVDKLLEFALLIKERRSPNPVSLLSVVPNDEEAEINVLKSKNKMEEFSHHASASEIQLNTIATIDHNATSGIARISREIRANIILMAWPPRTGILEKIIIERVEGIVNSLDKSLFISHFPTPLVTRKRIILITHALAERENGFELWVLKICKLAQELSIPIVHYGVNRTHEAIKRHMTQNHLNASVIFESFRDWEDFLILARDIKVDDLIVFVSSRKGSVSYESILDTIPGKLEKHFEQNSKILIYPQQYGRHSMDEMYEDIPSGPLTKSIETIERGFGSIFRKKNE